VRHPGHMTFCIVCGKSSDGKEQEKLTVSEFTSATGKKETETEINFRDPKAVRAKRRSEPSRRTTINETGKRNTLKRNIVPFSATLRKKID